MKTYNSLPTVDGLLEKDATMLIDGNKRIEVEVLNDALRELSQPSFTNNSFVNKGLVELYYDKVVTSSVITFEFNNSNTNPYMTIYKDGIKIGGKTTPNGFTKIETSDGNIYCIVKDASLFYGQTGELNNSYIDEKRYSPTIQSYLAGNTYASDVAADSQVYPIVKMNAMYGLILDDRAGLPFPNIMYKRTDEQFYHVDRDNMLSDDTSIFTTMKELEDVMYLECSGVTDLNDVFGGKAYGGNQVSSRPLKSIIMNNVVPSKTGFDKVFAGLNNLEYLRIDNIDTSAIDRMQFAFGNCKKLTHLDMSTWDLSNMKWMPQTFYKCVNLKTLIFPSNLNSNLTTIDMDSAFINCESLEVLDLSMLKGAVSRGPSVYVTPKLHTVDFGEADFASGSVWYRTYVSSPSLVNHSGYKNLKTTLDLSYCPLLSYDSAMNFINKVYDLTEGGTVTDYTTQTLTFHADVKALLSDEDIAIATSKGWTIA